MLNFNINLIGLERWGNLKYAKTNVIYGKKLLNCPKAESEDCLDKGSISWSWNLSWEQFNPPGFSGFRRVQSDCVLIILPSDNFSNFIEMYIEQLWVTT